MVVVSKYIVPKGYASIALYPFLFLKTPHLKFDKVLLNHEKIHLRQQIELLVIPFYLIYVFEFLIRLIQYRKWNLAYRNISFEREAYNKEHDLEYLNKRLFWAFLGYIRNNEF